MINRRVEVLAESNTKQFVWDYVILGEGHHIKNPSKTKNSIHDIPAENRLVLTGTPIHDIVLDLWYLHNFVQGDALLETVMTFEAEFGKPILKSQYKNATDKEKKLCEQMEEILRRRIKLFFLRRTKEEVLGHQSDDAKSDGIVYESNPVIVSDSEKEAYSHAAEQANPSVVNETSAFPTPISSSISAEGSPNSTSIISVTTLRGLMQSSNSEDGVSSEFDDCLSSIDEIYYTVRSDDGHTQGNFQPFADSPTIAEPDDKPDPTVQTSGLIADPSTQSRDPCTRSIDSTHSVSLTESPVIIANPAKGKCKRIRRVSKSCSSDRLHLPFAGFAMITRLSVRRFIVF